MNEDKYQKLITIGASDPELAKQRFALANLAAETFILFGKNLHAAGHYFSDNRKDETSRFGHGSDEVVGVAILLQMGGCLVSASADLLTTGNPYAGAALLRQIVEIEYLAWAFNVRDSDAERWLRSDKPTRMNFFSPAKLRKAAQGKFRRKDYQYHCELGGHPTPVGKELLKDSNINNQLLLSDLLGHVAGIWEHFVCWAEQHEDTMSIFAGNQPTLPAEIDKWHSNDPLVDLPPPP